MSKPKPPIEPCVYCGSTAPREGREHVIPQGLGMFEQNWTLTCVCDDCNQMFGRELDLHLNRDSCEAYLRIDTGLKPSTAAAKSGARRMTATLKADSPFDGARVFMKPDDTGDDVVPIPPPQVMFRIPGQDWVVITERDLSEVTVRPFRGTMPVEIRIMADVGETGRLIARLDELGIGFAATQEFRDQPIAKGRFKVQLDFRVDATIRRAAAKISFNYLAKVLGGDVARRIDFDRIRDFIRHGTEPRPLVSAQRGSVLVGLSAEATRTHACSLGWMQEQQNLIGIVSLFNQITYGVLLAHSDSNEWAHIEARHLFDPFAHQITEVDIATECDSLPTKDDPRLGFNRCQPCAPE